MTQNPWFRAGTRHHAEIRLLCLPHAGATVYQARGVGPGPSVAVCPVQPEKILAERNALRALQPSPAADDRQGADLMVEQREDHVDTEYLAPVGELEQAVARIVADVLGVDRLGRDDSFYDFGGTSLQAIRICVRIEAQLGIKALPLSLLENDVLQAFVRELGVVEGSPRG